MKEGDNVKSNKAKKFSRETVLFVTGTLLLIIFVTIIFYVFMFLVNDVLPALTPDEEREVEREVRFNLTGFEELGL